MPNPSAKRHARLLANAFAELAGRIGHIVADAGHAKPGDAVEETAAERGRAADPLDARGRAQQKNCINAGPRQRFTDLPRFLRWDIQGQDAVDAGFAGAGDERVQAHAENRVGVAEDHERRVHERPHVRDHVQHARQRRPGPQSPARWPAESPGRRPADPKTARRFRGCRRRRDRAARGARGCARSPDRRP